MKFHHLFVKFGISCLTCLKRPRDGLKIAQDGFLEATLVQLEPKLAPSCLEMGSSWPQVASSWDQVGSKLAQVGPKISSRRLSWRVLEGSREGPGAKRCFRRPQGCKNDPQEPPKWPKSDAKKVQIWSQIYHNYDLQKLPEAATLLSYVKLS